MRTKTIAIVILVSSGISGEIRAAESRFDLRCSDSETDFQINVDMLNDTFAAGGQKFKVLKVARDTMLVSSNLAGGTYQFFATRPYHLLVISHNGQRFDYLCK